MSALLVLLMLGIWMVIAYGLPDFVKEMKKPNPADKMPPAWAVGVSLLLVFAIDYGYRSYLPQSESHDELQKLVSLVENNDHRGAVKKLQDIADDPPWREPSEPLEPREPGPF